VEVAVELLVPLIAVVVEWAEPCSISCEEVEVLRVEVLFVMLFVPRRPIIPNIVVDPTVLVRVEDPLVIVERRADVVIAEDVVVVSRVRVEVNDR